MSTGPLLTIRGAIVRDPQKPPPNRLEINNFVQNQAHFSLFVQALDEIYQEDQGTLKSYFQLAAIHGLPFRSWNNSGTTQDGNSAFGGYCTHGTVLFPTWHRPYVALFEQIIQEKAIVIARNYTGDAAVTFLTAAYELRVPYWDWAANIVPPAQIITQTVVEILKPNGELKMVPNPFLCYTFHPIPSAAFADNFKFWPKTLRYPTSADANAISDEPLLVETLQPLQQQMRNDTFKLLTDPSMKGWVPFSNNSAAPNGGFTNSLEGIHDEIHFNIGGFDVNKTPGIEGHMAITDVSAFDPIFWLHHANVDRLLSLWSAMNPGFWVPATGGNSFLGTWTIGANMPIGPTTDLTPFWKDGSTYWQSTDIETTDSLGYTYPEFNTLRNATEAQIQAAIGTYIGQKYGPPPSSIPVPIASKSLASGRPVIVSKDDRFFISTVPVVTGAQRETAKLSPHPSIIFNNGHYFISSTAAVDTHTEIQAGSNPEPSIVQPFHEWSVRVRVEKFALQGSFSVVFFLGPVPANAHKWHTSPSFAGTRAVFAGSNLVGCSNCRAQANTGFIVEGFVHLNVARPEFAAMDPEAVKAYLREHLSWRVLHPKRHPVHTRDVPSLEVLVYARPMWTSPGDTMPSYGKPQWFPEITEGREF
ncbi:Photo-regulated tyrosinase [Mycena sanguinolenta]|uniref:tyrosinase n=1 Tax=Mycena sanguinolenta TaxID=230812 RepID=A0A8H6ZAK3_9AGAR|nr:Photo-regulated tyrosinase [Mycena sanguinolenta]